MYATTATPAGFPAWAQSPAGTASTTDTITPARAVNPPLIARARAGDVHAFEALVRDCDEMMRGVAFRMLGSRDAMDDALQDAYVRAFRSIATFRGEARFSTWMHRIVTTTCIDHMRRRDRRRESALPDDRHDGASQLRSGASFDPASTAVGRTDVARALARLPVDQRAVVLLVDAEGYSYDEAAEVLGTTPGTVSSRITRARSTLRTLLEVR